jgi:hypothetical protein
MDKADCMMECRYRKIIIWSLLILSVVLIDPGSLIGEQGPDDIVNRFVRSACGQVNGPENITLRGYLKSSTDREINGAVIVIADLYDDSMEPVDLISLDNGENFFETRDLGPGSYQVYATANAYHSSKVFQVNASKGMTIWLNITLVPMEIFTGYCIDNKGPINEAILTLRRDNKTVSTTKTSSQGLFKIILPPGEYDLKINKVGYLTQNHEVFVGPGERITMNYTLEKVEKEQKDRNYFPVVLGAGLMVLIASAAIILIYFSYKKKNKKEEPEVEDFHCIKCGNLLEKGDRKCSKCGYELMKRCADCGSENPITEPRCITCGLEL